MIRGSASSKMTSLDSKEVAQASKLIGAIACLKFGLLIGSRLPNVVLIQQQHRGRIRKCMILLSIYARLM